MQQEIFIQKVNKYASLDIPFLFLVDFEMKKPYVCKLSQAHENGFKYFVNGKTNAVFDFFTNDSSYSIKINPINKGHYSNAFNIVTQNILKGNTYLLNLTFPTNIQVNTSIENIFNRANAPYKLLHKDFIVFSPECFIKIIDGNIYSYPMKGTLDASIPNAREIILQDKKELWEHNTIVDLIRNDLSIVSKNIEILNFRYITKIKTQNKELLQVSSEIKGELPENWKNNLGNIILKLLPAGSVSGAPKQKTLEIIRKAEGKNRGYYAGVFGVFDGKNLDSAVMIRYIEKTTKGLQFRSGGGITAMSNENEEYNELIDKIYVPII